MTDEKKADLLTRLRSTSNWRRDSYGHWKSATSVCDRSPFEAADEIERLRLRESVLVNVLVKLSNEYIEDLPSVGPDLELNRELLLQIRAALEGTPPSDDLQQQSFAELAAIEREHFGDPDKGMGIYAPRPTDAERLDWIIQHGIPTIRDGRKVGPFFNREGLDRAMKEMAAMHAEIAALKEEI